MNRRLAISVLVALFLLSGAKAWSVTIVFSGTVTSPSGSPFDGSVFSGTISLDPDAPVTISGSTHGYSVAPQGASFDLQVADEQFSASLNITQDSGVTLLQGSPPNRRCFLRRR